MIITVFAGLPAWSLMRTRFSERHVDDGAETGAEAERIGQVALDDLVDHAHIDDMRQVVAGGSLCGGKRDTRRERSDDRDNTRFVQLVDLGRAHVGARLGVGEHGFEARTAHRLDATAAVDVLDREHRTLAGLVAREGDGTRYRMEHADLDGGRLRLQD